MQSLRRHRTRSVPGIAPTPSVGAIQGRLLAAALALALAACLPLSLTLQREVYSHLVVIDITRSMNVEDYPLGGRLVSRLAFVKAALRRSLAALPCGSRLGLGVFTDRRAALLFEPIEVCSGYAAIDGALAQLDWRMAWAADSRIADSLHDAMEQFRGYDASLVFISDGQEAPPVNPRYRKPFDDVQGKLRGLILGTGGLQPAPIPKFGEDGRRIGYYGEDEVPQRSTFGLSELPPEQIEGYHARNAPFGNAPAGGSEHLSALRESYLQQLAEAGGLAYRRLIDAESLQQALLQPQLAGWQSAATDLRPLPAGLALLALVLLYGLLPWLSRHNGERR